MTIDDVVHIVQYLRTWRDLRAYLDARSRVLREPDRRVISAEHALLCYYTAILD